MSDAFRVGLSPGRVCQEPFSIERFIELCQAVIDLVADRAADRRFIVVVLAATARLTLLMSAGASVSQPSPLDWRSGCG